MLKKLSACFTVLFVALLAIQVVYVATANDDTSKKPATVSSDRIIENLPPEFRKLVQKDSDNSFTISAQVADKKALVAALNEAHLKAVQQKGEGEVGRMCTGPLCGTLFNTSSNRTAMLDSEITISQYFRSVGTSSPGATCCVRATMYGSQTTNWLGSNPYFADTIVLGMAATVEGVAVGFTLPVGVGFSVSNSTASFTTQPFSGRYDANASYDGLVSDAFSITGLAQSSSGTVRIDGTERTVITYVRL